MKKVILLSSIIGVIALACFVYFEPSVGMAAFQGTSTVSLTVNSDIALTGCNGTVNLGTLDLVTHAAIGTSAPCYVKTTSATGYILNVKATNSPAMKNMTTGSDYFTDYSTTTPSVWSIAANTYKFGFHVFSTTTSAEIGDAWETGTSNHCGTGGGTVSNGTSKYTGFTTTGTTTMTKSSNTTNSDMTLCVAAEIGDNAVAPSGGYQAKVVFTATVQ